MCIRDSYTVLQAEVGQTTTLFSVDESSMWRNYLDNEYRDALKQAVNGVVVWPTSACRTV